MATCFWVFGVCTVNTNRDSKQRLDCTGVKYLMSEYCLSDNSSSSPSVLSWPPSPWVFSVLPPPPLPLDLSVPGEECWDAPSRNLMEAHGRRQVQWADLSTGHGWWTCLWSLVPSSPGIHQRSELSQAVTAQQKKRWNVAVKEEPRRKIITLMHCNRHNYFSVDSFLCLHLILFVWRAVKYCSTNSETTQSSFFCSQLFASLHFLPVFLSVAWMCLLQLYNCRSARASCSDTSSTPRHAFSKDGRHVFQLAAVCAIVKCCSEIWFPLCVGGSVCKYRLGQCPAWQCLPGRCADKATEELIEVRRVEERTQWPFINSILFTQNYF